MRQSSSPHSASGSAMDFHHQTHAGNSPSSSTSSSSSSATPHPTSSAAAAAISTSSAPSDPMHSWWESISKARSRIHSLSSILDDTSVSLSLSSLADSDRPALSLLSSPHAYAALSSALSAPASGSGSDPLCHWLYDTFLSSDPHLRLVVLSFLPLISGLYLSRIHSLSSDSPSLPSLAGFEAVLLAIYAAETKSRAGKPVLVSVPDLSQPSLYHTPRQKIANPNLAKNSVGVLSPPLEPQIAVKSTKRACIVGVALDCFYKQISQMPAWSKLDFCRFASAWAGQECTCERQFDDDDEESVVSRFSEIRCLENGDRIDDVVDDIVQLRIENGGSEGVGSSGENSDLKGSRIPLPWELLQPALRILGHCLLGPLNSQDVKDTAAVAVRRLYARAAHDLIPQAILATRSLIQLDKRSRVDAKAAAAAAAMAANSSSNANTPSKAKKPEILLVSK